MSDPVHDFSARQQEVFLLFSHNDLERALNRLMDLVYEFAAGSRRQRLIIQATRLSMQYRRIEDRLRKDELSMSDDMEASGRLAEEAMEMVFALRASAGGEVALA